MLIALRSVVARLNRRVRPLWPRWLGGYLAFRALSRIGAYPGVRLERITVWGGRFRCALRDFVPSRIYYFGLWEPNLTAFVTSRLAPGDVFVDVGANVGYFTVLASKLVGSAGRVVAIEASPATCTLLDESVMLNDAHNVRTVGVAVSDHAGTAPLYGGPAEERGTTSLLAERGGAYEGEVRVDRIGNVLTPDERARLRLMKIDIEGAELPVLRDLLATIDDYPATMEIVVEISPDAMTQAGTSPADILTAFGAAGFNWYTMENHHDIGAYSRPTVRPPTRGRGALVRRADVVLTRADADVLRV